MSGTRYGQLCKTEGVQQFSNGNLFWRKTLCICTRAQISGAANGSGVVWVYPYVVGNWAIRI